MIDLVGEKYWPGVVGFQGPWVYPVEGGQFVFNYSKDLSGYETVRNDQYKSEKLKLNRVQWLSKSQLTLDGVDQSSEPVFVFNSVSTDPKAIDYKNPILYASSFEVVGKTIPFTDTEDWMSLILHEAFHQFQFSNSQVFEQYKKLKDDGVYLDSSQLALIYEKQSWFRQMLLDENVILLKARAEAKLLNKRKILSEFFKMREMRRERYKKETGKSLAQAEAMWEMLEGGARYFEYGTFRILQTASINQKLAEVDSNYGSNKRYRKTFSTEMMEDLGKDKKRTRYFYTTGFNLYMLLEQADPQFSKSLFDKAPYYAESILKAL